VSTPAEKTTNDEGEMSKAVLHVVPNDQGWAVKREGNERASSTHDTQKDAIEAARELAKELDDIVIHRADGTIRERVTYTGSNGGSNEMAANNNNNRGGSRVASDEVRAQDLASVGTRVRWSAVIAGVVIGLALYVLLHLLALAIGLSTVDQMNARTFAVTAAVISVFILLASVFLGGFVASRATVGEQPSEAMGYGVLVWGTMLLVLLGGGLGLGYGAYAGLRSDNARASVDTDAMKRELNLSDQQAAQYANLVKANPSIGEKASPQSVAWWTFAGAGLSLLAAIGGGLAGAGPEFAARWRTRRETTPAVVPQT